MTKIGALFSRVVFLRCGILLRATCLLFYLVVLRRVLFPKFKVRDEFRYSQVAEKVRDAIAQEDYAYCNLLLTNLHRISERMLSKWRQGLSPKQCPRKWTSHIARWIRKSAPPLPFSIECGSDANARTVGVREMQKLFMLSTTPFSTVMSIIILSGLLVSLLTPRKTFPKLSLLFSVR